MTVPAILKSCSEGVSRVNYRGATEKKVLDLILRECPGQVVGERQKKVLDLIVRESSGQKVGEQQKCIRSYIGGSFQGIL